jgi:hypothetical protein
VLLEGFFDFGDGHVPAVRVPVHHAVKAHGIVGEDIGAERNVRVQGAGGADAEDVQGPVHGLHLTGGKVDVRQGVQFGHDNVDVVGADAMRQDGDALAHPLSGDGDEFAEA